MGLFKFRYHMLPRVFLAQAANALPPLGPIGNKQLSRRAAYNSLVRLKNNSNRLEQAPAALRDRLLQSSNVEVPSDLIELLQTKGSLDDLAAHFKVAAEEERFVKNTEEMIPMTQLQIEQIYGLDGAKQVMRNKAVDVTCLFRKHMHSQRKASTLVSCTGWSRTHRAGQEQPQRCGVSYVQGQARSWKCGPRKHSVCIFVQKNRFKYVIMCVCVWVLNFVTLLVMCLHVRSERCAYTSQLWCQIFYCLRKNPRAEQGSSGSWQCCNGGEAYVP